MIKGRDMNKILKDRLIGFFLVLCATLAFPLGEAYGQAGGEERGIPKVGLVLSGGGAKGAAHIGVLKYMEEVVKPELGRILSQELHEKLYEKLYTELFENLFNALYVPEPEEKEYIPQI